MKKLEAFLTAVSVGLAAGFWWPVIAPRIYKVTLCRNVHSPKTITTTNADGSITFYCPRCRETLTLQIFRIQDLLDANSLFDLPKVEPKPLLN